MVYDDLAQIVHNPNLAPWKIFAKRFIVLPVAFATDLGGAGGSTYRPLYWLSIALDFRLSGVGPLGYHVTNLVLHIANGFLGFRLLRKLQMPLLMAAGTCLIWLGLPINSEVVAWISGRSYALCGVSLLLGLHAALAYQESLAKRYVAGYLLAAIAALLSNESGVLVLPLTLLILNANKNPEKRVEWRKLFPLIASSLLADAAYLLFRRAVGAHSGGSLALTWSFGSEFWTYVHWIVLPIRMSVERSTSTPANAFSYSAIAAWAGLVGLFAICVMLRKKRARLCGGIAWATLGLLPFCGLVANYQGMAERFTYIASAGVAFTVAALASESRKPMKSLLLGCVAVWILWSGWRLHTRAEDWSDPVALYQHSLEANPESPALNFNLAFSKKENGDMQGAEAGYLRTIELRRDFPGALTSLGEVYLQTGNLDAAERQFVRAIAVFPHDSSAYTNLGVIFSQEGRPADAARMFSKAIENKATDPTPYFNLAVLMQQAGHGDLALPLYRKVLELEPGDRDTLANMQKIEGKR